MSERLLAMEELARRTAKSCTGMDYTVRWSPLGFHLLSLRIYRRAGRYEVGATHAFQTRELGKRRRARFPISDEIEDVAKELAREIERHVSVECAREP